MTNPVRRILTHKTQRKLTSMQVFFLLTEYVGSSTTYLALSEKYGVSQHVVSKIVRGLTYRELTGIGSLRKRAQEKAMTRYAKYSNAEALRGLDPATTCVEVDFNSVESIDIALLRLLAVRSLLIAPAAEVSL